MTASGPPSLRSGLRPGGVAWCWLGALLVLPSLLVYGQPGASALLAWMPALWSREPWRLWSAAWLHQSDLHLAANVAGAVLVIALGVTARLPPRAAVAWALAWPLTHLGLLAMPALQRYGGLSGVLHAGVAVIAVALALRAAGPERRLGLAMAALLVFKLLSETPWRGPLTHPAGWDVAVAPLAHASGAIAGALAAALLLWPSQPRKRRSRPVVE